MKFAEATKFRRKSGEPAAPHRRNHGPAAPPKVMKNAFYPATTLDGSVALPFVIPSSSTCLR